MDKDSTPATDFHHDILSIGELNRLARQSLEKRFPLLWVRGEISNLRRPASGHVYFALKDEAAQVDCVLFRNRAQLLPFSLKEGLRVDARAQVTLYEARGSYQLNIESVRHAGVGALFEAFTRLRARLEGEGLFAPERKKILPRYPQRIGIITSLQAAALQDIRVTLSRRAPNVPLLVYPTLVQGESAAGQIAQAIERADRRRDCDVLILARGGGSLEDLWAFNEEPVARALVACALPVITGIGHETDLTIADLVADCRAATPTAAAELVSAGFHEARETLTGLARRLDEAMRWRLRGLMQRLDLLEHRLVRPGERLTRLKADLSHLAARLAGAWQHRNETNRLTVRMLGLRLIAQRPDLAIRQRRLEQIRHRFHQAWSSGRQQDQDRLARLTASLAHLSPQAVLQRGYALVRQDDGAIVRRGRELQAGERIHVTFAEDSGEAQWLSSHP